MRPLRVLASRVMAVFGRSRRDAELAEEIESHLELLAAEHRRRGLAPRDARFAARRDFGGLDHIKEQVRERRGLAYYVFAANHAYTDAGSLYSQAGVDINRVDEAVTTIVGELKRIVDEAVPSDELEKAKNVAKGRFVLQLESPHATIMFGLRREILDGGATEPEEVLQGIDAVTADDVQRVAQDVIGSNGLNLALIGPFDDEERFQKLLA
jgi:predicted Zn-dependent peptidase